MSAKRVPIEWSARTLSWNAICPDCKRCVFMVTDEAAVSGPRRPSGSSLLLPVTMRAPHDCPGPALQGWESCPERHASESQHLLDCEGGKV